MSAVLAVIAVAASVTALWLWRDRLRLKRYLGIVEAESLRTQLDHDFLYKALNAVAKLGYADPHTAEDVVTQLSQLLRKLRNESHYSEIALRDEASLLDGYLKIQKVLLKDRLQYQLSFDGDVMNARVPSMIIQPLAENALTHGVGKDGVARLVIKAMRGGDNLIIVVVDTGPGLRSGLEPGIGLSNIRARLQHLYGDAARLKLLEPPGGGLMAQLVIPFRENLTRAEPSGLP